MIARLVTTITSDVDIDTLVPSHSVEVESDDLPEDVAMAILVGALRTTLGQLGYSSSKTGEADA